MVIDDDLWRCVLIFLDTYDDFDQLHGGSW